MEKVINIKNLTLGFGDKKIINDVSLEVNKGEIVGIIGESGSGKTVITSTLTGLNAKTQTIQDGTIEVKEHDVTLWGIEEWSESRIRGKIISTVFQNPLSSLNPYIKVGKQIKESIKINRPELSNQQADEEVLKLLDDVMIQNPQDVKNMYPHEMSGGMNQRIVICTIIAARPEIIIFDEPTTALDPLAQAEIIGIVQKINKKYGITSIFITHDIALIASFADKIKIMYAGEIIEEGTTTEIIDNPKHPYTWGLLASIPGLNKGELESIPGKVPSDITNIIGDVFALRSEYALEIDFVEKSPFFDISKTHRVKSWLYDERSPKIKPPKLISDKWKKWEKNEKKKNNRNK